MTFYTDTFTGKSIEGIVPYQSINLDTASVQLYWPNQTLPTAVSNQYVGSVTECVKTINGTNSIILPSSSLMPLGTSFTLVCFFMPTTEKTFTIQTFTGKSLVFDSGEYAYRLYTKPYSEYDPETGITTVYENEAPNWGVMSQLFSKQARA